MSKGENSEGDLIYKIIYWVTLGIALYIYTLIFNYLQSKKGQKKLFDDTYKE